MSRVLLSDKVEAGRVMLGDFATDHGEPEGAFHLRLKTKAKVVIMYSTGRGWDHVSASMSNRAPTWIEMSEIKDLFFAADETVFQLHVPKSDHINVHNFCLHLWRPQHEAIPMPPEWMV